MVNNDLEVKVKTTLKYIFLRFVKLYCFCFCTRVEELCSSFWNLYLDMTREHVVAIVISLVDKRDASSTVIEVQYPPRCRSSKGGHDGMKSS